MSIHNKATKLEILQQTSSWSSDTRLIYFPVLSLDWTGDWIHLELFLPSFLSLANSLTVYSFGSLSLWLAVWLTNTLVVFSTLCSIKNFVISFLLILLGIYVSFI